LCFFYFFFQKKIFEIHKQTNAANKTKINAECEKMASLVDKNKTVPLASAIIDASTQLHLLDENEYTVLLRGYMFKIARYEDIYILVDGLLSTLKQRIRDLQLDDAAEDKRLTDRLLFFVFLDTHVGIDILRQYRGVCRDVRLFRREVTYLYLLRMEKSAAEFVEGWGLDTIKEAIASVSEYEYALDAAKKRSDIFVVNMIEADSGSKNKPSPVVANPDDEDECDPPCNGGDDGDGDGDDDDDYDEKGKDILASPTTAMVTGHKRSFEWKSTEIIKTIKRVSRESSMPTRDTIAKYAAAHKYCDKVLKALLIIKENLVNINNVDDSNEEYRSECAEQMEWFAMHFCLLLSLRTEIVFTISPLYDSVLSRRKDIHPGSPLGTFVMLRFFTLTHLKMLRHQITSRMLP